jgi:DNA-binding IclR family transcriptional regulator
LVKKSSQWCEVVVKKCSTTSSPRRLAPRTPLPPRRCESVLVGLGALGIAAPGDRHDDVLLGDEVLHGHVAVEEHDLVRRSSPNLSTISASSVDTIERCRSGLARMSW